MPRMASWQAEALLVQQESSCHVQLHSKQILVCSICYYYDGVLFFNLAGAVTKTHMKNWYLYSLRLGIQGRRWNHLNIIGFLLQYYAALMVQKQGWNLFGSGRLHGRLYLLCWNLLSTSSNSLYFIRGWRGNSVSINYLLPLFTIPFCFRGVGFLRYFQIKQLPNFLLASPILSLALSSIISYARSRPRLLLSQGFLASLNEKPEESYFEVGAIQEDTVTKNRGIAFHMVVLTWEKIYST